jgi:hypothetical protein
MKNFSIVSMIIGGILVAVGLGLGMWFGNTSNSTPTNQPSVEIPISRLTNEATEVEQAASAPTPAPPEINSESNSENTSVEVGAIGLPEEINTYSVRIQTATQNGYEGLVANGTDNISIITTGNTQIEGTYQANQQNYATVHCQEVDSQICTAQELKFVN